MKHTSEILLARYWSDSEAQPAFIRSMSRALVSHESTKPDSKINARAAWTKLPMLCCQAAGGNCSAAERFALAWASLYAAAHIMDAVEDSDARIQLRTPAAINAATGLYATSGFILSQLSNAGLSPEDCLSLCQQVQNTILRMCSAQDLEFHLQWPSLDQAWLIASEKSGSFFALACVAGTSMATKEQKIIDASQQFGMHLGLLVQIANDAKDLWGPVRSGNHPAQISRASLPIAYTLSVADDQTCQQLLQAVESSGESIRSTNRARRIMRKEGADLFLMANAEKHRYEAQQALNAIGPGSEAIMQLARMVEQTAPMQ